MILVGQEDNGNAGNSDTASLITGISLTQNHKKMLYFRHFLTAKDQMYFLKKINSRLVGHEIDVITVKNKISCAAECARHKLCV